MPSVFRDARSVWDSRPRPPSRLRAKLAGMAVLACGAGIALAVGLPGGRSAFQAGPVADAHALFQNDCRTCHDSAFQTARRLVPGDRRAPSVSDAACLQCHEPGPHHASTDPAPSCAACHQEHRGRAVLARVADHFCLECHTDLKNHADRGVTRFADVTGFPEGHPAFARRTDPGRLQFNHSSHLHVQGILGPGGELQQLDCAACHVADDAGRYMRPVKYADHCATCHALSVQLAGRADSAAAALALENFAREPAAHKRPAEVRSAVRERLAALLREHPLTAKAGEPPLRLEFPAAPLPSETQWQLSDKALTADELRSFLDGQLAHVESLLFERPGGCQFCHLPGNGAGPRVFPGGPPDFEETRLPARWQPSARFRHAAHRMVGCAECHPAQDSHGTLDLHLPALDSCVRCHNAKAGARHDCAECHTYHHGPRDG